MAQALLSVHHRPNQGRLRFPPLPRNQRPPTTRLDAVRQELKRQGRFSCFLSDGGRKKEQARKALEGALGGKKSELEKWNKEIDKRAERGGGGGSSGRGGGGWFGWFNDDGFRADAQQGILALLGIIILLLLLSKGNVMFAIVFNSLLFVLRGSRNCFAFASSRLPFKTPTVPPSQPSFQTRKSAKDSVVSKWGTD